ncbi:uroporphyrinogen-III synthase [Pseudooceanicola nanhaiensis]|uniref:uroporphyrinogen-III synthase n=1 Tax=Pseudooceanicola nanhaiensis TaxID=375761 RepID=UPI001CD1BC81|nr:uroporphyrinogen-III synthase [Pseudooceanicola nanhaiensis]MCA0920236.1 uroporphyrinogen-III synthase [Pseudooceanicola nanhaiensis]
MKPAFLLTRPAEDARVMAAQLAAQWPEAPVVISPLQRIVFAGALPDLGGIDRLVFTSRNGVRAWSACGGPPLPAYTVGEATAAAARAAGHTADVLGGDVDALGAALIDMARTGGCPGGLLHVHGVNVRGNLVERLAAAGLSARGAALYDQKAQPLSQEAHKLLDRDAPVLVPLFSPRSAALFEAEPRGKAPLYVAAMSVAVVRALGACQMTKCAIALRPDAASMMEAMAALYRAARRVEGREAPQ